MAEAPPYSSEREIAIAVVIDCGVADTTIFLSKPAMWKTKTTNNIAITEPSTVPERIGIKFFFNSGKFSYKSTTIATVAGAMKNIIKSPPCL